jgi:hypothetical protein
VFGGSSGNGLATPAEAAYAPASDRWPLLASAPIATRLDHAAVWTGREMLVWGGHGGRRSFGDGAAYDPRADRWRPIAGRGASPVAAAWTGTRMLVWDAPSAGGRTTGALYDPVPDRWTPITHGPALNANRSGPVWTGTQLVTWNGTGPEPSPTPRRPTAGRPCRLVRWSGVTARGDDGLDGPRGGDLERLEHGGGIAAVP